MQALIDATPEATDDEIAALAEDRFPEFFGKREAMHRLGLHIASHGELAATVRAMRFRRECRKLLQQLDEFGEEVRKQYSGLRERIQARSLAAEPARAAAGRAEAAAEVTPDPNQLSSIRKQKRKRAGSITAKTGEGRYQHQACEYRHESQDALPGQFTGHVSGVGSYH
jgi:hypothetical protein